MPEAALRLLLVLFEARARAAFWLLLLAYGTLAAFLLHSDATSIWTWAALIAGALILLLFMSLVRFWTAFFRRLGDRNG